MPVPSSTSSATPATGPFDEPFAGVLLDLDGTLIDSIAAVERSWVRWCGEYGVDPVQLLGFHGMPAKGVIATLLPEDQRAAAFDRIRDIEVADVDGIVVLPGAADLLAALAAGGVPTAIVTSGTTRPGRGTPRGHRADAPARRRHGIRRRARQAVARPVAGGGAPARGRPGRAAWWSRMPSPGCAPPAPPGAVPGWRCWAPRPARSSSRRPTSSCPDLAHLTTRCRGWSGVAWPWHRVGAWMPTSWSWVPASPAWSPPASSPTPAGRWCCSTRRARPTSAARRGGASAGCSSSTPPSSAGWASPTRSTWPGRTGRAPPAGTGSPHPTAAPAPTTGAASGGGPTSSGRPARSGPGSGERGISFFPVVGWAERGDGTSGGHGNSVPRFHIPWGTGTGVVAPFERTVREHIAAGRVIYRPRHRVDAARAHQRRGHRGAGGGARAGRLPARGGEQPRRRRRVRVRRPGGHRDVGRHRGQPRPGARQLARAARQPARRPAHRRARLRRRPDARHHRGGRWRDRQPRPDVALRRGRAQLGPGLARARHPHPARPELDVVRRARATGCPLPFLPGFDTLGTLDHLRHTGFDHSWFILNRVARRQGVRPLRVGAEPRPHREALPRGAPPARHQGHPVGAGLPRPRRGLAHRRHHR